MALTGGLRARSSGNMSQNIGETGLRRHIEPHIPPWLCAALRHFGNCGPDCLGPCVSRSAITSHCLGKRLANRYGTHVAHLSASVPIKCYHVSAGGTAPPLLSRQVQISAGSLPHPKWVRGPLSVPCRPGTLQIRHKSSATAPAPGTGGQPPAREASPRVPWHQARLP
jgi:hypothetical protein